jgi:hypothetical protein
MPRDRSSSPPRSPPRDRSRSPAAADDSWWDIPPMDIPAAAVDSLVDIPPKDIPAAAVDSLWKKPYYGLMSPLVESVESVEPPAPAHAGASYNIFSLDDPSLPLQNGGEICVQNDQCGCVITMNEDRLYVHYLFRKTTDKTLTSVEEFRDEYTKAYARVPSGDIGGSMITSVGGKVAAAAESSLPLKSCRIFLADVGKKLMETNKETITGDMLVELFDATPNLYQVIGFQPTDWTGLGQGYNRRRSKKKKKKKKTKKKKTKKKKKTLR